MSPLASGCSWKNSGLPGTVSFYCNSPVHSTLPCSVSYLFTALYGVFNCISPVHCTLQCIKLHPISLFFSIFFTTIRDNMTTDEAHFTEGKERPGKELLMVAQEPPCRAERSPLGSKLLSHQAGLSSHTHALCLAGPMRPVALPGGYTSPQPSLQVTSLTS